MDGNIMYTIILFFEPLVSAGIAIGGGLFAFGKSTGRINQKCSNNEKKINCINNELYSQDGRPQFITRTEFNNEVMPEMKRMVDEVKSTVDKYKENQENWIRYLDKRLQKLQK